MFERIPRIPIDNELNLPNRYESSSPDKYVERLLNRLDEAFTRARKAIKRDAIQRKEYFDKNHRCHKIEKGDIVLVRRCNLDSNYKISDRWEEDPWQVVGQYKDFPVYIIKPIGNHLERSAFSIATCCIRLDQPYQMRKKTLKQPTKRLKKITALSRRVTQTVQRYTTRREFFPKQTC